MIPFNVPLVIGDELAHIQNVIATKKFSGDGDYTKKCSELLAEQSGASSVLLTTSCTHALEMAALLADIKPGDEVIMPSFTFSSTANAFALRGARLVFIDIRPDTMNMDENCIEEAITPKTKAIVPVHYAGVSCEMDKILSIAEKHNLMVIEDAAQGLMSSYKGKPLGSIGDLGCYSFHETKNYNCGEGGALLIRNPEHKERAEIIREKGTDRSRFLRGQIDKYTWADVGSSYLLSELNAAFLYPQLLRMGEINKNRLTTWDYYYEILTPLHNAGAIELPVCPEQCTHNAHIFYIKCADIDERTDLAQYLKQHEVQAVFHYIPLHSAPAGQMFGRFNGEDRYTTLESEKLLRLPLYYGLESEKVELIVSHINAFYRGRKKV